VLVVNHARSGSGRLDELTAENIDAFLHENVRASLLLVREFAAQFEGESGRVVLFTSGAHKSPMTGELAYAISKGAPAVATLTLAEELARHHRQLRPPRPDRHGLRPGRRRPCAADAVRPLGRAGRRRPPRRVAVQRRRPLDHRPGGRVRGRLPPLDRLELRWISD
jgi:NAD(P)-dependent dehydrogenase (short-subunit alcohol dehydrogenase family)